MYYYLADRSENDEMNLGEANEPFLQPLNLMRKLTTFR